MGAKQVCLFLGGNGFIGSHIVDKLALDKDLTIRVLDQFDREPQFHSAPNIVTVKGSAHDKKTLAKVLKNADYVVHSLAATSPFTSDSDPFADIETLKQSVAIFEQCAQAGVKKVGFISSGGAVYGNLTEHKVATETDLPMPVSPYGICKLATEYYLEYFRRKYGTDYVVYRLSNPYGPRQVFRQTQGVISAFLHRITNDQEIVIFGDGTNSRDYIYIEDAATMIAGSLRKPNKHKVYNIGSGHQTTLMEIIEALKHIFEKEINISFQDAPKTFLQKTDISVQRFWEEFGEVQVTPFHEGLAKTVAHAES